ncbi:hypothetical protein COOONC_17198 [Cooperia oncophora]
MASLPGVNARLEFCQERDGKKKQAELHSSHSGNLWMEASTEDINPNIHDCEYMSSYTGAEGVLAMVGARAFRLGIRSHVRHLHCGSRPPCQNTKLDLAQQVLFGL